MEHYDDRDLFEIPAGLAYFNTAYNAPLLRSSREALEMAASAKSRPWERTRSDFFDDADALRPICADLFGGGADDYAVIPAASYGVSTAARILESRLQPGDCVLVIDQDFPSNVLPWRRVAAERGATIRTATRPADGDWTTSILASLDKAVKVAALCASHWTDGARVDLDEISRACRDQGTALVLDMTQSLGAVPFDVGEIRPDFMVASGYKWLLCPYGVAFMYVAPQWQDERPLEETWLARANIEDFSRLVEYCDEYRPGARRFDGGETCVTTVLPGAIAALQQLRDWRIPAIFDRLRAINVGILERIETLGFRAPGPRDQSGHMFGIGLPPGVDAAKVPATLSAMNVYVSLRGQAIRIAPHLHVTRDDVDQLVDALSSIAH